MKLNETKEQSNWNIFGQGVVAIFIATFVLMIGLNLAILIFAFIQMTWPWALWLIPYSLLAIAGGLINLVWQRKRRQMEEPQQ